MKLKNNENNKENMKKKLNNAPYECSKKMHLWIQIVLHVVLCLLTTYLFQSSAACGPKTCLKLVSMPGPLAELLAPF